MPNTAFEIESRLRERLNPSQLEVIDESAAHAGHSGANADGFGTHFRVRIAAPGFAALSRVDRHRRVYDALAEYIVPDGVHAVAIEEL